MSEEKKLTDEEIVKALECCKQNEVEDTCAYCSECPASDWDCEEDITDCTVDLFQKSISLIHRLQIENKTIKTELRKECEEHEEFTKKAKAEIERLTEELKVSERNLTVESRNYESSNHIIGLLKGENAELQKQVDELTEGKRKLELLSLRLMNDEGHQRAVKDTAKKFADLVEFHSIARMNDGVEYFTISALGLKEILVEEFGFKYSELNGVEVE